MVTLLVPLNRGLRHLTSRWTLNQPPFPKKVKERGGLIPKPSQAFGLLASSGPGTLPSPPLQAPSFFKSPPQNQSQSTQIGGTSPAPPSSSLTQDMTDAASIHSSRFQSTSFPSGSLGLARIAWALSIDHAAEQEMLQVQDTVFELAQPHFAQSQAARASED
ncbi:uncharacterized protein LACBIDRAFT_303355 [Laccaria bicolor S238N-H82]|uniref:Predicted protein n=1 Tax=Laccaria bicolor (strain S238N-H82 / ATCC MYA-4686) TaxID=486041 RepID=B0DJD4_LACBS|nr:uncharacterized protein LACBIDRAFT_303355 [Laccaria bicolor S238N-H82]EDR05501.1 predicted protein [Laccaria bicolor S238N-H82]|eukprot:XP_001884059.1 predicted protein [Laccaria bicolor S238N-H82]